MIFLKLNLFLSLNKIFFTLIIFLFFPLILSAENEFRQELMNKIFTEAKEKNLHQEKDWRFLVQYWKNIFYLTTSRVDDSDYFLSKNGKNDPEAELLETLRAFYEAKDLDSDENPQCKFPARFFWLNERLKLVERGVVKLASCSRYNEWKSSLAVKKIHLIFPAAYLNNPASMFGHTLFRLDSERSLNNPLLSYAANFGAATGNDGGVLFAVKGLLGGYPASFSVEPYYETVKRYGDIEHRDIWEYELLLSEHEVERFLSLLWELGSTYFDYYFFDENCSFYVLALLDFVRPELNLLSNFTYWVIPSDTLKVITSKNGLTGEKKFRPSLSTKLVTASEQLSSQSLNKAKKIAKGEIKTDSLLEESNVESNIEISKEEKARLLEFSYDYLEFLSSKGKVNEEDSRKIGRDILAERSKLPSLMPLEIEEPEHSPEDTHPSGRFILSAGGRERTAFYNISIKPAYHDTLDTPDGFKEGAAIDFFHANFRHYENGSLLVQSFYPVAIESYTPWNKVFRPISWDVSAGLFREFVPKEHKKNIEGSLGGFFETSGGITMPLFSSLTLSTLLSFRSALVPAYDSENYAIGAGPKVRLNAPILDNFRMLIEGSFTRYSIGETYSSMQTKSEFQLDIWKSLFFRAGIKYERIFDTDLREGSLGLGAYF